jgi:3-hydroxybutyryl-CoA dehydratase
VSHTHEDEFVHPAFRADAAMVRAYARLTLDENPIHLDAEFALRTAFGRPIAHGTLSLNALWQAFAAHGIDLVHARVDIKFTAAVFVGDELRVHAQRTASQPARYQARVLTHEDRVVVEAEVQLTS